MKVGITGHQQLEHAFSWGWVHEELNNILSKVPYPLVGVTSLAVGADQSFARAVLEHGGTLEVIIPFDGYERTFTTDATKREYYRLLHAAIRVETLKRTGTDEEAYLAAGQLVVDRVDLVIAVWNGKSAVGLGGTADIVRYARDLGKSLMHLNTTTHSVVEYPYLT